MNNTVTYDWVASTVKPRYESSTSSVKYVIENILKLDFNDFILNSYGINRYSYHYAFADIKVYFSLIDVDIISEKMGVFIEMRGTGCRQYEEYMDGEGNNWTELFIRLLEENAHFTRIDIANDIYDNALEVQKLYRCSKEGLCVTRSRKGEYHESFELENGEIVGETVNFGQKGGDGLQWGVYNKALEQTNSNLKDWVRSELRLFGQKSNEIAKLIVSREPLEEIFFEVLSAHFRFVVPSNKSNDNNRWRRPNVKWWDDYLGTKKQTKLEVERKKRTLEGTRKFIEKQSARSLAMVFESQKLAFGEEKAFDYLAKLLEEGSNKLTVSDITQIEQFAVEQNSSSDWGQRY
ncbi:replication initiation factor domain-containing protein [Streptococcus gallolyticus]|nr:replication initiation factor domain-containing protein [Streptococcus gallolyticus]MBY5041342.1 replication initiation factor domain-containing protein [Streptococcus gallolyticus]